MAIQVNGCGDWSVSTAGAGGWAESAASVRGGAKIFVNSSSSSGGPATWTGGTAASSSASLLPCQLPEDAGWSGQPEQGGRKRGSRRKVPRTAVRGEEVNSPATVFAKMSNSARAIPLQVSLRTGGPKRDLHSKRSRSVSFRCFFFFLRWFLLLLAGGRVFSQVSVGGGRTVPSITFSSVDYCWTPMASSPLLFSSPADIILPPVIFFGSTSSQPSFPPSEFVVPGTASSGVVSGCSVVGFLFATVERFTETFHWFRWNGVELNPVGLGSCSVESNRVQMSPVRFGFLGPFRPVGFK